MTEIRIGNRVVPLFYSTYEMIAIQEEIGCTAFQLKDEVFGLGYKDEDDPKSSLTMDVAGSPEKTKKLGKLIRILGNAGLEEKGEKGDLTDKWVLRNMRPAMITGYAVIALSVIIDGNRAEVTPAENEGPVDEGLEEEIEKKQPGK